MASHARVAIIGGGAVGASIAYHLTLAGIRDVLLVEKDELTSGSTWHAAGNIPTYATSWLGMRAGNYAWHLYKDLGEAVDSPITYRHTGAFWPAHSTERMDLFHHLAGVSKSAGFDLSIITPSDMEAMHPFYRARADQKNGVIGGIFDPYEGDIDPSQLTQALAKGARDRGATIARFTRVTAIARTPSGDWRISTDKGEIICEIIVNAAGFYGDRVAGMAGLQVPVATLEHQYLVTDQIPALAETKDLFPLVRDPDVRFYLRREGNALLLGSYAHDGRPAWPAGPPEDFAHQLFPDAFDDIAAVLDATVAHLPILGEAGAQRFVNGPIAYAPDGLPLVGPAAGCRNFYHATGVQIGITHSAAIGKAITEWVQEGESEWDLAAWDPRRFGDWANAGYAVGRATELYGLQYAIPYPHRILKSARPVRQTPLYDKLKSKGAVFGQIGGWERAFWFQTAGGGGQSEVSDYGHLSFRDDEPWRTDVAAECLAVRDHVGVMDHGGFAKYEATGPGAETCLDKVFCSAMPSVGRVRLSYMLTHKGHIWSEATIARLAPDRFLLCGPTLAVQRDFDWLTDLLPDDGSVTLTSGSERDAALLVMGPKARGLLQPLTDTDLSGAAQPWMSVTEMVIAGIAVTGLRVSYVGELGWELHVASADLEALYDALSSNGTAFGLRDFGSYALNAMRVEKGYHGWGADFGTEYTPFDAGLGRFVDFRKPDFVGREALLAIKDQDPPWAFCGFEVDGIDADPLPSDPILHKGDLAGYVTSASTGFRTGKRLVLGYVAGKLTETKESFEIESFGKRIEASRASPHAYDPKNLRLKS